MKAVFLDSVGILAVWQRSDQWHVAASRVYLDLSAQATPLVTTSFFLAECANAAARRGLRPYVSHLRDELELRGAVVHPSLEDWRAAWTAYDRGFAANAGFVDQLSFVVMRRLNVTETFTNDRHFRAAGFVTLF